MDIVLVSTYPPVQCGIGTYSQKLGRELAKQHRVTVLAEVELKTGPSTRKDGEITVLPLWNRKAPYDAPFGLGQLLKRIKGAGKLPDVIHVQHEFGLFPDSEGLGTFLLGLQDLGVQTVVTLHTVKPKPHGTSLYTSLLCTDVIVHTAGAAACIVGERSMDPRQVRVIPHGVDVIDSAGSSPIPRIAEDKDGPYFLVPGFVSKSKNHKEILEGWALYKADHRPGRLFIVGECRDSFYLRDLENLVSGEDLSGSVQIVDRFMPDHVLAGWYAGATAVVLGCGKDSPYSASGQHAGAISHRKPVIAKAVPIYEPVGGVLQYRDGPELARCLRAVMSMEESPLRDVLFEESTRLAKARAWSNVVKQHVTVYESAREI